ncbi:hypothetical protein BDP27DRAFT_905018 [Rhodocollybia butyracea]|uniref:Uncharacterized protein n=1 Tax=Rhodocollybia butyracea TaxID=206335 RepID=A0A9P5U6C4_9AGAR|nr:hypothetical protein BDP27DRAFT_905018 [Rhodocollybia butyracea]
MSSTNVSAATNMPMTAQPQAAQAMNTSNAPSTPSCQDVEHGACKHKHNTGSLVSRIRGAGAGKDCFIGLIGCFLCFECCEGCCHCVGDIICCPCEMCC